MGERDVPRRPRARVPRGLATSLATGLAVVAVLVALTAGAVRALRALDRPPSTPFADARGARLGTGPPATAYPWPDEEHVHEQDPWGFAKRQCTSYVAWYLNAHGVPFAERTRGPRGVGTFAGASGWADAAAAAGFAVTSAPAVGSVAHWGSGEGTAGGPVAGCDGHVAVVLEVAADGRTVRVAEYDGQRRQYLERTARAPRYLRIGSPAAAARTGG